MSYGNACANSVKGTRFCGTVRSGHDKHTVAAQTSDQADFTYELTAKPRIFHLSIEREMGFITLGCEKTNKENQPENNIM